LREGRERSQHNDEIYQNDARYARSPLLCPQRLQHQRSSTNLVDLAGDWNGQNPNSKYWQFGTKQAETNAVFIDLASVRSSATNCAGVSVPFFLTT
jgi:hypothetical protein